MLRSLFFTILSVFAFTANATHIVGGEITYTYLGNNQYQINLSVFIDCINGQPGAISQDAQAYIGVFDGNNGNIISGYPVLINRSGPVRITKVNYNCISTIPNACVDHYWYQTTLTLPPRAGGYVVSFQRCCRNNTITNLQNPEATGANYWTHIPDPRTLSDGKPNSSPVFKNLPANFLCTNTILKFDHSANDKDGDSLAYDLFWPYNGASQSQPRPNNGDAGMLREPPFVNVTHASGYDFETPIDGNPPLTIDPETGYLTLIPTKAGQYVVGIRVREYRNGVLIGETKRDYQFNVQACVIDMVAAYYAPKFICGYTFTFDNNSIGAVRYHWDFGVPGTDTDTSNQYEPAFVFPAPGKYRVSLITYKNNCIDSFVQEVTVVEPTKPKLPADTIICSGKTVTYSCDVPGDSYRWSNGSNRRTETFAKEGMYWVEVTVKTCKWRDTVIVKEDKDKVLGLGDTIYCTYDTFDRKLTASGGFATYQWNTGSKLSSTWVDRNGDYVVTATTVNNCPSSDTVFVEHYPPVEVVVADTIVCPGDFYRFNAQNSDAFIQWSTGDEGQYLNLDVPGIYFVKVTRAKCYDRDTFELRNYPHEFALGPDLRYCNTIDTFLDISGKGFKKIIWNSEVSGEKYHLTEPGKIVVTLNNRFGCPESDSLWVYLFPNPGLDLGSDTLVCLAINPVLDAGPGMVYYKWQDGKNERFYTVYDKGLYWVEVMDAEGCRSRDSVFIDKNGDVFPSLVYMPNAFTPDGNRINDLYPDNKYTDIGTLYNVKLYNRWGERIAEFQSPNLNWDGNINGNPAPEGAYVYLVTWIGCDNKRRSEHGSFHLMR